MKRLVSLISCGAAAVCVGVALSAYQGLEKRGPRAYPGSDGSGALERIFPDFSVSLPSCGAHEVRFYEMNELLGCDTLYLTFATMESCSQEFLLSAAGSSYGLYNANLRGGTIAFPSEWETETPGWKKQSSFTYAVYRSSPAGPHVAFQFSIAVGNALSLRSTYVQIANTNTAGTPS
jgi:hypothetical protein